MPRSSSSHCQLHRSFVPIPFSANLSSHSLRSEKLHGEEAEDLAGQHGTATQKQCLLPDILIRASKFQIFRGKRCKEGGALGGSARTGAKCAVSNFSYVSDVAHFAPIPSHEVTENDGYPQTEAQYHRRPTTQTGGWRRPFANVLDKAGNTRSSLTRKRGAFISQSSASGIDRPPYSAQGSPKDWDMQPRSDTSSRVVTDLTRHHRLKGLSRSMSMTPARLILQAWIANSISGYLIGQYQLAQAQRFKDPIRSCSITCDRTKIPRADRRFSSTTSSRRSIGRTAPAVFLGTIFDGESVIATHIPVLPGDYTDSDELIDMFTVSIPSPSSPIAKDAMCKQPLLQHR
ncbi:hypothetical protein EJ08DRAFT_682502 [Tothia fuscella]|uniref:Uncharacterized protein n=1 Tax=Tothia fuscella TaxID=1048955 RepID=A0A9P4NIY9_9PEZI|nr:hypothetical protein EJ08DRAFT_682502 [Tothia fuscella]